MTGAFNFYYFPSEGWGPVGKAGATKRNVNPRPSPNWAPAFAGEVKSV
jgi:hypothetical protein